MVFATRPLTGMLVVLSMLAAAPVMAQRVQFPSSVPDPATSGPAPSVTLEGIGPPPSTWDAYGTPGSTPSPLLPNDPHFQFGPGGSGYTNLQRVIRDLRLEYEYIPRNGQRDMGLSSLEMSVTAAFPMFYNTETPLLVTPGFAINWLDGPPPGALGFDMPPRTYDAYLDAAWQPQPTDWLGGDLAFRIGVYSDFEEVTSASIRYTARGLAEFTFTPAFSMKAGVIYYDRARIKLLPAGGLIWTPNSNTRFEILFPNPKFTSRLTTIRTTEWWWYVAGNYGGDSWSFETPADVIRIDYNDIRVALGLEFKRLDRLSGMVEFGLAWERELYGERNLQYDLKNSLFLRAGLTY